MANEVIVAVEIDTKSSDKSIKSLRNEIKSYRDELVNLERGTEEYNATLQKLAASQSQINNINLDVRASTLNLTDVYGQVTQAASGLVGGFTAVTSATALLGVENEALAQTFVKLQAGMALIQSLNALSRGIKAANIAFKAFNTTLYANPIIAIVAAVAALVAGLATLGNWLASSKSGVDELKASNDAFNKSIEQTNAELEFNIQLLQAQGVTEEKLNLIRREQLREQIEDREQLIDTYDQEIRKLESSFKPWFSGQRKRLSALKELRDEQIELVNSQYNTQRQLNNAYSVFEEKEIKRRSDAAKKSADEREKAEQALQARLLEGWENYWANYNRIQAEGRQKTIIGIRDAGYEAVEAINALYDEIEPITVASIFDFSNFSNEELDNARIALQEQIQGFFDLANNEELSLQQRAEAYQNYERVKSEYAKADDALKKQEIDNNKAIEKAVQARLKVTQASLQATSIVLGSIGNLISENTAAYQAVSASSAIIGALAGQAQVLGDPTLPFVLKIPAALSVLAAGITAATQIKNTEVPGSSGDYSPTIPSVPSYEIPIQPTVVNNNAFDNETLNQPQVVLVLEDLNQVQDSRRVAVRESQF